MSSNMFSRFGAGSDPDIVDFDDLEEAVGTSAWTVVDVREPHEFAAGHIPNALNLPTSSFDPQGPAARKARRPHLPGGRTVAQRAEQGARGRPRGREALCWGHERLALAERPGDSLTGQELPTLAHLGARHRQSQAPPLVFRGSPAT